MVAMVWHRLRCSNAEAARSAKLPSRRVRVYSSTMTGEKSARSTALLGCGVIVAALLACKTKGTPSEGEATSVAAGTASPGAPLNLSWEQPYKLVATGAKGEATFFATKEANKPTLKLQGSFHGFPKGTKVKFGGDEGTLGDGSYWSTLVDIKPAVLKQTLEDLKGPIDVELEVSITPPGAPAATTKLQKQNVAESLRFALLKARDGGVSFDADDVASGKPRGAAVISGYSDLDFVGAAKVVKELDWIVVAEDQTAPRETKSCTFKEGKSTLKVFDANVVAYDRRTGAKTGQQVLKASSECPSFAFISKKDNSTKSSVAAKDVVAWARTALASGPAAPTQPEQRGQAQAQPGTENRVSD
jgi:hypothetical protein